MSVGGRLPADRWFNGLVGLLPFALPAATSLSQLIDSFPQIFCQLMLLPSPCSPRPAAVVGLADGINVQKPALMANCAEQQLPAPPIRCGAGALYGMAAGLQSACTISGSQ